MGVCMSKFISLRILASLSKSKKASIRTPRTPPAREVVSDGGGETSREEPVSSSRISVNRERID